MTAQTALLGRPIQVGDIVSLRSGGPEMTVTGLIANTDEIECSWFVKRRFNCEDFPPIVLIMVRPIEDGR